MHQNHTPRAKTGPKLTPITLTCKGCGETFTATTAVEKQKTYCSRACYHRSRERTATCERCGTTFKMQAGTGNKNRFCSNACKRSGWNVPRSCSNCGETFTPTNMRGQQCCSKRCALIFRHANSLQAGKRPQHPELTCRHCGKLFQVFPSAASRADRTDRLPLYCSKPCKHAGQTKGLAHKRRRSSERQALRRAQKLANGPFEEIDTSLVIARDGTACHICGEAIDVTLSGWDPMGLTFDHVIPLARGGPHTLDNLKPAHRVCNIRKGARVV